MLPITNYRAYANITAPVVFGFKYILPYYKTLSAFTLLKIKIFAYEKDPV